MNILFETDEIRVLWNKGLAGDGIPDYGPKGDVITHWVERKGPKGEGGNSYKAALTELIRAVRDGNLEIRKAGLTRGESSAADEALEVAQELVKVVNELLGQEVIQVTKKTQAKEPTVE